MVKKKFLFVMQTRPHHGINLQEKLDVILTIAAFDQKVGLLFLDDGIFQIKKNQQVESQKLKDTACIFNALEMYDVKDIYVEFESLQERGLSLHDLTLPVESFCRKEIHDLMAKFDIIFSG